jgi:hypothetical protein
MINGNDTENIPRDTNLPCWIYSQHGWSSAFGTLLVNWGSFKLCDLNVCGCGMGLGGEEALGQVRSGLGCQRRADIENAGAGVHQLPPDVLSWVVSESPGPPGSRVIANGLLDFHLAVGHNNCARDCRNTHPVVWLNHNSPNFISTHTRIPQHKDPFLRRLCAL